MKLTEYEAINPIDKVVELIRDDEFEAQDERGDDICISLTSDESRKLAGRVRLVIQDALLFELEQCSTGEEVNELVRRRKLFRAQ